MNEIACISVIVPIYNTEEYLDACIASIANQSHTALQIILVDDGSQDASGAICDAWAGKDKRIQVIHQKNAGVSAARNTGLEIATGEIISFVDSDDLLLPDAYTQLLNSRNSKDIVIGRMKMIEENGALISYSQSLPTDISSLDRFIKELFQENLTYYLGYLWDKLFVRSVIQNKHIRFDPAVRLNEDRLFLLEYLLCCNGISFCNEVTYAYRQRNTGVISATRRNNTVTDSEMTVIDSFHRMATIGKAYSDELFHLIARKSFECALDLRNRVARTDHYKIKRIRRFMWENAQICLSSPDISFIEKSKIIGHCILEC